MISADLRFTHGEFTINARMEGSGFIGLIGGNGSGKTTFLRLLAGIYYPDRGTITVGGRDVTELPINRRGTVYLNSDTYFGHVPVRRHVAWSTSGDQNDREREINDIMSSLGITYKGRVSSLSLGQRSRVILATALVARPPLILVDELFANISERGEVIHYFSEACRKNGTDVVCVTQDENDLSIADSVFQMKNGTLEKFR